MKLILFRHLWGVDGAWEQVFPQFKKAGYRGIESKLPLPAEHRRFRALLAAHGFDYIPQIFTQGRTVAEHVESFRVQVAEAAALRPRFINAHSGRDAFTEAESERFFAAALKIEAEAGVAVAHETHRGRILFNPWITSRLLKQFDGLKLCCDFSHWVCVCERLIDDELAIIRQCAARCIHLHARVGYEEGPQVSDPRAPEYQRHLAAHERWWRVVWLAQQKRGDKTSTLTPEFGPPSYLHTLPFADVPVSDLREICDWQARRQAANFARCVKTAA
ncbi:MAG: TIM barrel protein [Verrucomicrobiia bacterium]|jgi:sugar phosphate isomerase/epimerase